MIDYDSFSINIRCLFQGVHPRTEKVEFLILCVDNLKIVLGLFVLKHWSGSDANFNVSTFDSFEISVVVFNFYINQFVYVFFDLLLEEFLVLQ